MIKSMTGYGRGEEVGLGKRFTVEVRSVNHRYSDINIKTPRSYAFTEDSMRKTVSRFVSRGKVDVLLSVEGIEGETGEVSVNMEIARGYLNALRKLQETLSVPGEIVLHDISRFSDVFSVQKATEDAEAIEKIIRKATEEAVTNFTNMREKEGKQLFLDMSEQTNTMEEFVLQIEQRAPMIVTEYSQRLQARMTEILDTVPVDEGRLLNEVAIFSDRVNVNEELIRLKSHILQMRAFLEADEPIGRKMDFLIQEMNREVNTIGSKSNDLSVARLVIDLKAVIEKLREQVQNVE